MKEQTKERIDTSDFYSLAQKIMAHLAGAQGKEIDTAVNKCLGWLGEYFGIDSVSLGGISKSGELMPLLYLWGKLPPKEMMLAGNPIPGPDMVAQFNREGYLVYNRPEDLNELPQFQEHTRQMGALAGVFWKHRDRGSWVWRFHQRIRKSGRIKSSIILLSSARFFLTSCTAG